MSLSASNKFRVAGENTTNIFTDAQYNSDSERTGGYTAGVSIKSKIMNTTLRETSLVATALIEALKSSELIDTDTTTISPRMAVDDLTTMIVNRLKSRTKDLTVTLLASGWGSTAPYSQTVSVDGVTTTSTQFVSLTSTSTTEQTTAIRAADLQDGGQALGTITLLAYGTKPTIDLPIRVCIK